MRKTLALLTATAALAGTAQSAIACDDPTPPPTSDLQLVVKPLDRRPHVAMPSCPDCRYHLLDTRS